MTNNLSTDNAIIGDIKFIKQFPQFSLKYAKNCASYVSIASDNHRFMEDYNGISLYQKVPTSYKGLQHNYSSIEYTDLNP